MSFTLREYGECGVPCWCGITHRGGIGVPIRVMLPHSKSMTKTPACAIKSVPSRPAASVGSEHTRNACSNRRPFISKETDCQPLISRTLLFTPYGFMPMTLTSRLDMPGCSIESLNLVSKIRCGDIPSVSTKMEGVPRSNKTETEGLSTAFSEWLRRRKLPSRTPRQRFPYCWLSV